MISRLIEFSLKNKLVIILFTLTVVAIGVYSLSQIPIGAVPDVTNNQVQVITTSRDLSTQDVEQFITYPIELEMANLPGVKEIRSISKFGLSVVTIVFDDKLGTYLPRQLIAEKIKSAAEQIPEGFGSPEMGPITTGLGEIYQYVLEVDAQFKDRYTAMDLRTVQDWIVRRQLSGIPGVVEVNTWGGFLKQYEVSLDPNKLRAMNISITEVFKALESNNHVSGGGYIEKGGEAYFIRGEGLTQSLEDIGNVVVENRNGIPIFIKDIAEVGLGYATRFGAVTGNGEGEKVLGQVMMLKDANSKAVIDAVKQRVEEIETNLPEGISINAFLERSELIEKTTSTIAENLILGCLIVVFVVVILLGNIRSGLVVASVIPLCLLFAISLMYIFGVDANLMSLGAIDFGIIIDGAVIIVEYIAFKITSEKNEIIGLRNDERQSIIDRITSESTNKMMHSAVFGQLIIIIVFIPILSLVNVEGKMFRPMALTFSFALIGAMIFCFTYVPVLSSLFLKPSKNTKLNFSQRLINWLQLNYEPILSLALSQSKIVIGASLGLLIGAALLFNRLGGEFVPTLDEGDFVIQPIIETGTSLSRTVELTTEMEQIIKSFPEVKQVVTRIGAAEVPTDPMSMEEPDVMISLKPKSKWQTAATKDELANNIKSALLQKIPDVDYEFTQPIEMRFNELITGVRADLAIKVFGEDLKVLVDLADQIEKEIQNVEGASDITVEKIEGLPQMSVKYDRAKIARFGLNIKEVNDVISMGFAGKVAGSVFEGEKRFDLVTRFNSDNRRNLEDVKNTFIVTSYGQHIPLKELATITYTTGPAKISRDDTRRRIVVSVNVRNRDLESVVDDVRDIIQSKINMPAGYYVSYGGQFENLQSARNRLTYAVPVALVLIFILLHFAFGSIKEALLIYTAIPLSAVGGVLFLWLRDLPFSISAGVGFIALFGIAVLNGIVLIEHYKELRERQFNSLKELIIKGTISRLRPVLLTALAAALGFLPMAISTSAGAEVQRPLATVVIGGLITATLLTLVVLPVIYYLIEDKSFKISGTIKTLVITVIFIGFNIQGNAQNTPLTLDQAKAIARENNAMLSSQQMAVNRQEAMKGAAFDINNTQVYYNYDQNNIAPNNSPLKVWGIQQSFQLPNVYTTKKKLNREQVVLEQCHYDMMTWQVEEQVAKAYDQIVYQVELNKKYQFLDSAYRSFSSASNKRFETGQSSILEKLTAESKHSEIQLKLEQNEKDIQIAYAELAKWMQSNQQFVIVDQSFIPIALQVDTLEHPGLKLFSQKERVAGQQLVLQKNKYLPEINLEYFQGNNNGLNAQSYSGFQIGLGIPLFYGSKRSTVKAASIAIQQSELQSANYQQHLMQKQKQLKHELAKYQQSINYYNESGKNLSKALITSAQKAFKSGEIDFFQCIDVLDRGVQIQIKYLEELYKYNQTVLTLNYLIN